MDYFECIEGEKDAKQEIQQYQYNSYLNKHFNFDLLVKVNEDFWNTNLEEFRTVEDIQQYYSHDSNYIYTTYFNHEIPYLATIFSYRTDKINWINIKLNNDGFVYKKLKESYLARHNHDKWNILPSEYHIYFTNLTNQFKNYSCSIFYNYSKAKLDIKLYNKNYDQKSQKHILITFEPGYPDYRYQDEKYIFT